MSLDKIPYIGQYSKKTPNLYVATGFNKWGMTSSMVSAMILCDLVQGIKNDFADVFSPSRNILNYLEEVVRQIKLFLRIDIGFTKSYNVANKTFKVFVNKIVRCLRSEDIA